MINILSNLSWDHLEQALLLISIGQQWTTFMIKLFILLLCNVDPSLVLSASHIL